MNRWFWRRFFGFYDSGAGLLRAWVFKSLGSQREWGFCYMYSQLWRMALPNYRCATSISDLGHLAYRLPD